MPHFHERRRDVFHDPEFEEQLRALIFDAEQALEYTAAAGDLLSRKPRSGVPVARDGSIWLLPMSPVRGRQVSLYYTFDENTVTLYAILSFDGEG